VPPSPGGLPPPTDPLFAVTAHSSRINKQNSALKKTTGLTSTSVLSSSSVSFLSIRFLSESLVYILRENIYCTEESIGYWVIRSFCFVNSHPRLSRATCGLLVTSFSLLTLCFV